MPDRSGLIYCRNEFTTNSFCISKLIELLISLIIFIAIVVYIVLRYRQERKVLSFSFALCGLMLISLICNIVYCLDHTIHQMNFLQQFFYSMYFTLIVYYVSLKLMRVMQVSAAKMWTVHILFIIAFAFNVSVLITKQINGFKECQELWYLVVDGYAILLSIVLTVIGITYTKKEQQKLAGIGNPQHYKNPILTIWIWISVNILSQIFGFGESMFFQFSPDLKCNFTNDFTLNQYLKLLFAFFSFQLGMIATLLFFLGKYQREMNYIKRGGDHTRRASVHIQLMESLRD